MAAFRAATPTLESKQLQILTLCPPGRPQSLLKLTEMKGLEYFPTNDGFVFSTAQLHAVAA